MTLCSAFVLIGRCAPLSPDAAGYGKESVSIYQAHDLRSSYRPSTADDVDVTAKVFLHLVHAASQRRLQYPRTPRPARTAATSQNGRLAETGLTIRLT